MKLLKLMMTGMVLAATASAAGEIEHKTLCSLDLITPPCGTGKIELTLTPAGEFILENGDIQNSCWAGMQVFKGSYAEIGGTDESGPALYDLFVENFHDGRLSIGSFRYSKYRNIGTLTLNTNRIYHLSCKTIAPPQPEPQPRPTPRCGWGEFEKPGCPGGW